jgi:predicted nuclease with TOPRIM domain
MALTQAEQALKQSMENENENLRNELERYKQFYRGLEHDFYSLKNQYDREQERMKVLNDENEQLRKQNRHLLAKLENSTNH